MVPHEPTGIKNEREREIGTRLIQRLNLKFSLKKFFNVLLSLPEHIHSFELQCLQAHRMPLQPTYNE